MLNLVLIMEWFFKKWLCIIGKYINRKLNWLTLIDFWKPKSTKVLKGKQINILPEKLKSKKTN
jgi:hypothetical protein